MRRYIRSRNAAGCYFFTVNLSDRRGNDLLVRNIGALREAFRDVQRRHPFTVDAVVILPEHLHVIWTLPPNDADFSTRWRLIKSGFSRALPPGERVNASRARRQERGIWQRRFWEHAIRDEGDWRAHVDYIHYNPVKHGHATRAVDWPYSSIHRHIREGLCIPNWAVGADILAMDRE
ncbi:REP-associated tyrosine transposase [Polycyclovorans algicola]|uniref:REP-associated tyrosine transposase n=1 Tax=Polycyclovorans algicola TaxID=616992 RepID=UPI0004A724BC|nr:transposase [Polycyclovorans algicola]